MSCAWGSIVQAQDLQAFGLGDGITWLTVLREHLASESNSENVGDGAAHQVQGQWQIYTVSLYWAVVSLTSIGYGDIVPVNSVEYSLCVVMAAVGSSVWAYVIGGVCGILSSMDPHTVQFQQSMDDLNVMMHLNRLPGELRRRLRTYLHENRNLQQRKSGHQIVDLLSPTLKSEVELKCNQDWMDKVWYLRGLEADVVAEIARTLEQALFAPQEVVVGKWQRSETCQVTRHCM